MECRNIILLTLEILPECSGSSATSVVGFTREFRERTAGAKRRLMKQKLKSVSRGAADWITHVESTLSAMAWLDCRSPCPINSINGTIIHSPISLPRRWFPLFSCYLARVYTICFFVRASRRAEATKWRLRILFSRRAPTIRYFSSSVILMLLPLFEWSEEMCGDEKGFIATRWWMPQCPPRGEKQHGL